MAKYLTDRQDRKLEEMARKLDGLSERNNRLPSPSSQITGTDFGSIIVPRETIPAATRTVQAGSDKFTPGEGTAYLFRRATGGEIEPRLDRDGAVIFKTVYNLSSQSYAPNNAAPTTDYIGPETDILYAHMDRSAKLYIPADAEAMTVSDGAPLRTVWGSTLAPKQDEAGFYYINRNGLPDTDWALMDGISNSIARGGSGMAMWDPNDDNDTFFVRARGSATDADDTAGGRTVPFADPNQDIIQIHDHNDHSHEVLDLCEIQYVAGTGGDPELCGWDQDGVSCSENTECVSNVRKASACGNTDIAGVLEHTFDNGQGPDPDPIDFNVAPPNKAWHWFERIAETGGTAAPPFAALAQQVSQPVVPLPVEPIQAGATYQDDGSP